jgi:hypothetical protein
MMKAQAVFEFIVAALILFSIVIYTIEYLSTSFAAHHDIAASSDLESKAMRVSGMLLGDTDVGIFSDWPTLSKYEMRMLNDSCDGSGYFDVLDKFGLNQTYPVLKYNRLYIIAQSEDGDVYIKCGRVPVEGEASGRVVRFGYIEEDDEIANITVTVW